MKLRKGSQEPEIPTASMADIAFLLIVFFMLTTVFSVTKGLDFALPEEEKTEDSIKKEESIHVKVQADGTLVIDQRGMEFEEMLEYVREVLTRDANGDGIPDNPNKPVIIQTDPDAKYQYMMSVFDELRQAPDKIDMEVKNIAIPTQREIDDLFGVF
ncbi:ExbD/TolR family protein [Acidobacteriota bacterium]